MAVLVTSEPFILNGNHFTLNRGGHVTQTDQLEHPELMATMTGSDKNMGPGQANQISPGTFIGAMQDYNY
jgi:hypothetical protein